MNVLLQDWDTPFQIAPFDKFTDDDFAPAFAAAFAESIANVDAIAQNPDAATFANTIEALERADEKLEQVLGVFYNVAGADSTPSGFVFDASRLCPRRSAVERCSAGSAEGGDATFGRVGHSVYAKPVGG